MTTTTCNHPDESRRYGIIEIEDKNAIQEWTCGECGADFYDVYAFTETMPRPL